MESVASNVALLAEGHGAISEKLDRVVSDVDSIKSSVVDLKIDMRIMRGDVSVLKDDMREVKSDVSVLKDDMREVKSDVSVLKDDMRGVKSEIRGVKVVSTHGSESLRSRGRSRSTPWSRSGGES